MYNFLLFIYFSLAKTSERCVSTVVKRTWERRIRYVCGSRKRKKGHTELKISHSSMRTGAIQHLDREELWGKAGMGISHR